MPARTPVLRNPLGSRFLLLWSSVTAAGLGDGIALTAMPLLAGQLTGDPRDVSLVFLAEQLPWLLIGPVSGVVADRLDRRRVLWITDSLRAVVAGMFAVVVLAGQASIPLLGGVALMLGAGQVMYVGAWGGMVPALVEPGARTRANAVLQATAQVTANLLGSPLGAVLFTTALAAPFVAQAMCIACAAFFVAALPGSFRAQAADPKPRASFRQEVTEGIHWLWRQRTLRLLSAASGAYNLVITGLITVLALYAKAILGLGSVGYGLVMAAFAVGGLAGAAVTPRLSGRMGPGRVLTLAMTGQAVAVAAAGTVSSGVAFGCFIAGYGAASLAWNVVAVSLRQSLVPDHLFGRVNMAYQMVNAGMSALGAVTSGLIAHLLGLRAPFLVGAALLLAVTAWTARRMRARLPAADHTPASLQPASR
ncbi:MULTISPECIES: MFS transporter [unclassified Streptomyces]|uniref:MFS transporter n=1 Tax=unclassified Streptomyces TaxID=2593676 RepID=UPI00382D8C11